MISKVLENPEITDYLYSLPETIGISIADEKEILEKNIDFTILRALNPFAKEIEIKLIDDKDGHEYRVFSFDLGGETSADAIYYYFTQTKELYTMAARRTQEWLAETGEIYVPIDLFNKPNGLRERIKIKKQQLI